MRRPRLVETEIGTQAVRRDLVGNEVMKHQDIGLLEDLGSFYAFGSEEHVSGDRTFWSDVRDDQRLELSKPCELFVDAGSGVVPVNQCVCDFEPLAAFIRADIVWSCSRGGTPEVPTRHHVRVGVVVNRLVIFVRSDDTVDVAVPSDST